MPQAECHLLVPGCLSGQSPLYFEQIYASVDRESRVQGLRAGESLLPGGFPATPVVTPNSLLLMLELRASAGLTNRVLGFRDGRRGVTTTPLPINQSAFRRFGSPSSQVMCSWDLRFGMDL